jgi:hypothetical protein
VLVCLHLLISLRPVLLVQRLIPATAVRLIQDPTSDDTDGYFQRGARFAYRCRSAALSVGRQSTEVLRTGVKRRRTSPSPRDQAPSTSQPSAS